MRNQRRLFQYSILALLAFVSFSVETAAVEGVIDRLRVITYNVQFLPDPVSSRNERPNPEYRATRIAEQVSQFDIIALQETFHDRHRAQIMADIRKAWRGKMQSMTSPTPEGFLTSGGCLIASRMPIISQHSMVFTNYSKPADYGLRADGYAAKGVLHARIERAANNPAGYVSADYVPADYVPADYVPADYVDVFVTHLEARADELRTLQFAEIAAFVKRHSRADHPVMLLGDLNTRGAVDFRRDPKSQYSQLMQQLASARGGVDWIDLWPHLRGNALGGTTKQESADVGKRIDYLLLCNPAPPHPQLVPISVDVKLYQDSEVTALSDHNGVAAELQWR